MEQQTIIHTKAAAPVVEEPPRPRSQAERVIAKFGGPYKLAKAVAALGRAGAKLNPATIYRWVYPKAKGGTDGLIPTSSLHLVLEAARYDGIFLSTDDLDPRRK
jgi:amino-acid N-acetyltransferase